MSEFKQCPNGHFYQGDECPYCEDTSNKEKEEHKDLTKVFEADTANQFKQCPNGHYYLGDKCPYCKPKKPEIDKRTALYRLEYKLLPLYVEHVGENQDGITSLCDISIWERDIEDWLDASQLIDWDEISCEVLGDNETESIIVYEFPLPFDIPLARYGAVYINRQKHIYKYFTLERSLGCYMLCSTSSDCHANYGEREYMSKEEFIKEISTTIGIDDTVIEKRSVIKRKYTVPNFVNLIVLTDNNYNEFIADSSCAVVCFYGILGGSAHHTKLMLPILSEIATAYSDKVKVGIYDVYGMDNEKVREANNIKAMPTILFVKDGVEINRHIGVRRKEYLRSCFEELLRKNEDNINVIFGDNNPNPKRNNADKKIVGKLVSITDSSGVGFQLYEGRNIIGRDEDCNITVNDDMVSAKHAVLLYRAGKYSIADQQSTWGTFVNDKDIEFEPHYLQAGDIITIGNTKLIFYPSIEEE